ncbi:hypothetical protein [Paenibacillus sp. 1P03SA]|uniref:hypothetical protein n=1 Tax=Paenibacillus sp. 1P03SA TaxID=3132294 RepID=UPI0039A06C26
MAKTVRHDGNEYIVVEDHGPEEVTAYRELEGNNIEIFTSFAGIPRVALFHVGTIQKVLGWRDFSNELEHQEKVREWNWRHNREIEQGAVG